MTPKSLESSLLLISYSLHLDFFHPLYYPLNYHNLVNDKTFPPDLLVENGKKCANELIAKVIATEKF